MDLKNFGTVSHPLRMSSLPKILQCPARAVLEMNFENHRSAPADTGTAIHHAVAEFHRGKGVGDSLKSMASALPTFPLADLEKASGHFQAYSKDPRNAETPLVVEYGVGKPIPFGYKGVFFTGTLDQVRVDPYGTHRVWDIKTGAPDGYEMSCDYAVQLAGYTLAYAATVPGVRVKAGGIIRTGGYFNRGKLREDASTARVFIDSGMSVEDCRVLLDSVVSVVESIRMGILTFSPGQICSRCPLTSPSSCIPDARSRGLLPLGTLRL